MANNFFTVDLTDGSKLSFNDFSAIDAWLNHETKAFEWLQQGGREAGEQVNEYRNSFHGQLNQLRNFLTAWRNNPEDANARQQFYNFLQHFLGNTTFVRSDHPFARIASDIAVGDGPVAASAALGVLLKLSFAPNANTIRGTIGAILRRDGINPKSPEIVARQMAEIGKTANETRNAQKAEWETLREAAESHLDKTKSEFDNQIILSDGRVDAVIVRVDHAADEAIRKIETTEASYKEQMKLQAPVDYWSSKAQSHKEAIDGPVGGWGGSRVRLIVFAIVGSASLVGALLWLATNAVAYAESAKGDTAIYLKFAAIGAIVTTIIFWIGRVLLRIYLSDRHLLTDAEERVAMIKTYLALSNEGKVEAGDRALILGPIFKSASDGIVRDEGPDTSLGGVLAKLVDVRSAR